MADEGVKEHELFEQRLQSAEKWRSAGTNPYGNGFRPEHLACDIAARNADATVESLEATPQVFSVAGRIVAIRPFKNAAFVVLQDRTGAIQVHIKQDKLGDRYELFKLCDLGDFVGIVGQLFRTRTNELTLSVTRFEPLTKTLRPPPGKFSKSDEGKAFTEKNAMADVEQRYRQRYLDLLGNADVRETFRKRSKLVQYIRSYFDQRGYLEVETPMLHSLVSGAAARPFTTHHNALDMNLFMRIAPELHLKRLVVGGFDRVYEINRNFRNEGISTRHNPEFTMLEWYEAYATYEDLMSMTEDMLSGAAQAICGTTSLKYGEHTLEFKAPWRRVPMWEAIREKVAALTDKDRTDTDKLRATAVEKVHGPERAVIEKMNGGELIGVLFEQHVEQTLVQPTFVTHFPTEISPLARRSDSDPAIADRFELFVANREIANGFSELNDPVDQKGRFQAQVDAKGRGNEETMDYDEDYIRALEHGLPPTAGGGDWNRPPRDVVHGLAVDPRRHSLPAPQAPGEVTTTYRWQLVGPGAFLAWIGLGAIVVGLSEAGRGGAVGEFSLAAIGWVPFIEVVLGLVGIVQAAVAKLLTNKGPPIPPGAATQIWIGLGVWVAAWGLIAAGIKGVPATDEKKSEAVGAPLNPRLAKYRDFHWGTLAAYGFGILFAEVGVVVGYLLLIGSGQSSNTVNTSATGLSPVIAFVFALAIGMAIAFAGGFLGAANSKRLSTPEATVALLYFGLPLPILLSAMHTVPKLMLSIGYRLREVIYLASLLGDARPEVSYWLVYVGLVLALFLGINSGFVSTSSGRLDLRINYELFIASRHVQVFRPTLLIGTLLVLIFGVVGPLILYFVVKAAMKQIELARVRKLGLVDPLKAAEALNQIKLKELTPTAMMTALSVGGVGVGVMSLIVVLSVMSGFELDLQQKILGTNSHGVVLKYADSMPEYAEVMDKVRTIKGVAGQTPFILNEVMISSDGNISGSMIKGIDPGTIGTVTDLPNYMMAGGKLEWLETPEKILRKRLAPFGGAALDDRPAIDVPKVHDDGGPKLERGPVEEGGADQPVLPGIIVGKELASSLKVVVGDRINVVSPLGGELGPQGPMPKSRPFRVAGIFYSGMFEYDSKFVYIHLRDAQTFFGLKGATGIELKFDDVDDARRLTKAIYDKLEGYPYRTRDWGDMNKNLFAALRLEKLVMGIILSIIVIVAAGLIVATVIMLVLEKRKEIAVLKALGVPDGGIVKIFLTEGLQIGVAGGMLGLIAGLGLCLFIEKVGIKLDPSVYYIPALPVKIEPFQTALSVVIAILVTFLASIYPALKASQVEPVDGLKAE